MAVQPDKRSREARREADGLNLTERYRVGIYTLQAMAMYTHPRGYEIRSDRPGFPRGYGVYYDAHDGWVVHDGEDRFSTRIGPLACLEWFAGRRMSV